MSLALVQYSDSDSDAADAQTPSSALKRKRGASGQASSSLPPLPAAFHDLYSTNARVSTSDDPSLHGGRKRAVPHIDGNWPSHVYLEWLPSQAEFHNLNSLIDHVREAIEGAKSRLQKPLPIPEIHPSLLSELGAPIPLHISLSRTLQIKTGEREPFLDILTTSLRKAAVRPFHIRFTGLKWVPNYERNRWFLVLGIEKPSRDELNRLLHACNDAADESGLPPLYVGGQGDGPMQNNTFTELSIERRKSVQDEITAQKAKSTTDRTQNYHVSIAWNLTEPDPEWITLAQKVDVSRFVDSPQIPFDAVKVKIGNVVHNIDLHLREPRLGKRGGLLGL